MAYNGLKWSLAYSQTGKYNNPCAACMQLVMIIKIYIPTLGCENQGECTRKDKSPRPGHCKHVDRTVRVCVSCLFYRPTVPLRFKFSKVLPKCAEPPRKTGVRGSGQTAPLIGPAEAAVLSVCGGERHEAEARIGANMFYGSFVI